MAGTSVAKKDEATDVVAQAEAELEASLAAQNQSEIDRSDFTIPMLKIGQQQTVEVVDGDAKAGEFINALTREGLGSEVEFVVAGFTKGRFDHGIRGEQKARKAFGTKIVPESWANDPFKGLPFDQHPDAEEQFKARVNRGEIPWGKGPRISTTYDFTGYVVSGLEDGEEPIPVCLSLKRGDSKQAQKWLTILDAVLRGRYWDAVFNLTAEQQRNADGTFYTISVKKTRKTTPEEKQRAMTLAMRLRHENVEVVGDDEGSAAPKVEPSANGGLAV